MCIFRPGDRIGQYEVIELVGQGGMAEVYRARSLRTVRGSEDPRDVAIKVLMPRHAGDPRLQAMLLHEARSAQKVSRHPNIVTTIEVDEHEEMLFVVMEYVHGVSLAQILKVLVEGHGEITDGAAIRIAAEVASALLYARNTAGLVHRDVSPQNIMVSPDLGNGVVQLGDFGVATPSADPGVGLVVGKLRYMAPEQLFGKAADERADVFSMAVILYELLTGVFLFPNGNFRIATLRRLGHDEVPPPSRYRPSLPKELESFVLRMLAHSDEERPRLDEVCHILERLKTKAMRSSDDCDLRPLTQLAQRLPLDVSDSETTRKSRPILHQADQAEASGSPKFDGSDDARGSDSLSRGRGPLALRNRRRLPTRELEKAQASRERRARRERLPKKPVRRKSRMTRTWESRQARTGKKRRGCGGGEKGGVDDPEEELFRSGGCPARNWKIGMLPTARSHVPGEGGRSPLHGYGPRVEVSDGADEGRRAAFGFAAVLGIDR